MPPQSTESAVSQIKHRSIISAGGGGGGGKTVLLSSSLINGDSDCFFLILGCFEKMDEEYMSNLSYFRFSKNLKEEQFSLAAFLGVVGIEG